MRRVVLLLAAALALVLAVPGAAPAQERVSYTEIERQVMCVSCNVALNIAESPQAEQQKRYIRRLIAQGRTEDEILDELVATYGENVLASPKSGGIATLAYVLPIAGVLLLAGVLAVVVPRWRRREDDGTGADGESPELSAEDRDLLDADLARYDA